MGLIQCPDCGQSVSNRAPACIHCGRPFDDLPKKVIRICGTGECVLELEHVTQKIAEQYIANITSQRTYKYSYKYCSGSYYQIIPDDEPIQVVTDLKYVVHRYGDSFVKEAERLTPTEAERYKAELEEDNRRLNIHTEYLIINHGTPLNWHSPTYRANPTPQQPRCPTCGSPYIERISATSKAAGAFAFGLFSKTAKSQFRCKNCGYKW